MKFVTLLQFYVSNAGLKLVDIAGQAGIHAPDLSRIYNGKRACGKGTMIKLLQAFSKEQQSCLLQAWLQDQVPVECSDMVHIVRSFDPNAVEKSPNLGTLEGALEVMKAAASKNSTLMKVILNIAVMFAEESSIPPNPL